MNRRTFTQVLTAAAIGAAAPSFPAKAQSAVTTPKTTPLNLSVMLWTVFGDLPFEQRLAKVAEAGYNQVELVNEYRDWTEADFAAANAARKRLGIRFDATASVMRALANPSLREAFLADLTRALKPMETLSIPAIIVLAGDVVPGLTRQQQHDSCIETLKQALKIVEGRQIDGQPVRLLLECIHLEEDPKFYMTSADEGIEVVRAVNHPQVQFLYDIFHEQMGYGNLIDKLDKHIDQIGLIHVADVPGRHEPGTGEINYANIYRKLAQLNYRHNVAMEFMPTGDPIATLRTAKALALNAGAA
jgi:hydroxypyruvate isomerase